MSCRTGSLAVMSLAGTLSGQSTLVAIGVPRVLGVGRCVTFGVCMYSLAGLLIVVLLWVCLQVSVM